MFSKFDLPPSPSTLMRKFVPSCKRIDEIVTADACLLCILIVIVILGTSLNIIGKTTVSADTLNACFVSNKSCWQLVNKHNNKIGNMILPLFKIKNNYEHLVIHSCNGLGVKFLLLLQFRTPFYGHNHVIKAHLIAYFGA